MKAKLTFADIGVTVTVPQGTRIIEVSEKVGAGIEYGCRESDCGTCLTEVVSGMEHLSEKSTFETNTLAQHKAPPNMRLACQTLVLGDAVVKPRG
ncbi:MAG: 2Fe-2S iron-sulfur cluster binding domain-containing protein [Candidatus Methylophosphatis roskildensis]|jgi:ferredoxin|uniref:2Fe-2S iron-sulfur cluster binding domain-containing protein n=1 Tax=Candidatus Methylophosphatis roskildensis TaxID=2899263 RepID=A0A9D7E5M9_9PROT|nr:2Fe-2S iron-sulfur cluster binding domain-containing protein [Candidatus Methylophosphatis roskildensis]MBK7236991.1 2Fe-2S iron-sulfur cluster binding domain-containing protein [Sterolibacteriaceae bacterium]MBK7665690.1 2Fe-2S iron-sulfur cluster binding domain-containing protein [Sterolibacteriaceae bacterium]MBK9085930.1 2Fe-2S iron-sulfur cluster binding domain-containing protein [Sterolibacteriaceae bacterium]